MPHREWCGRPCSECDEPCDLDKRMPCSPDCPLLSEEGYPAGDYCNICDAVCDATEETA